MITREKAIELLESEGEVWHFLNGGDSCIEAKVIGFFQDKDIPDDDTVRLAYYWGTTEYEMDVNRLLVYETKEDCALTFETYEPKTVARFCSGYERDHG